jgi:hypothetical protein
VPASTVQNLSYIGLQGAERTHILNVQAACTLFKVCVIMILLLYQQVQVGKHTFPTLPSAASRPALSKLHSVAASTSKFTKITVIHAMKPARYLRRIIQICIGVGGKVRPRAGLKSHKTEAAWYLDGWI